jgi:hypothetical protein
VNLFVSRLEPVAQSFLNPTIGFDVYEPNGSNLSS